jgi:hypothetical protein
MDRTLIYSIAFAPPRGGLKSIAAALLRPSLESRMDSAVVATQGRAQQESITGE